MEHVCTQSLFRFWDGKTEYTVMFQYGTMTWYVFNGREETGSVQRKKIDPRKSKTPNRDEATAILEEYLETIEDNH